MYMMEMYLIIEYEDDQVLVTINREVVNSVSHSISDIRFFVLILFVLQFV